MAEFQDIANQALKKLEDQLTCAICLGTLKDPKLLQCFHVYCKDCLQQLVVQEGQEQFSICCPTCRQSTLLPTATTDVSLLQSAFHIHNLLEIQGALEKLPKEPKRIKCDTCNRDFPATSYCRDCGKFVCAMCASDSGECVEHKVVALEQLERREKQLDALKKVTLYCSLHEGKELELYCETCGELICLHCAVNNHCSPEHKYGLVSDTFERHKREITLSTEPIEEQLDAVVKAVKQLELQLHELTDQQTAIEVTIQQQTQHLVEVLLARKAKLIGQLNQHFQVKLKNLIAQKGKLETLQAQLISCLSFVKDILSTGSQGEVMKMKKPVMKQIKEMTDNFKPGMLPPCELANVKFNSSLLTQASQLQQFGEIYHQELAPTLCFATGKALEIAKVNEMATSVVCVVDHKDRAYTTSIETVTGELVSETTGGKTDCSVKKTEANQYEISYQPTARGRHQLHIKVEGEHIKGSPFGVTVKLPVQKLGTPINTINGVNYPFGVTINQRGEIIVAECSGNCVSILNPTGEKLKSFGSHGLGSGQFDAPRGVAVDDKANILVVDVDNHCIQKFTSGGKLITVAGRKGNKPLEFNEPLGIAIHPLNNKVYVADNLNHRIQILNPDLTFSSTFGSRGKGNGQFISPWDVAFDSTGNVYVVACSNHCVYVFTAEGKYLRKFGKKGNGNGELNRPSGIAIDNDDVVYIADRSNHRVSVFTNDGKFLTLFGTEGRGPGQFSKPWRIAVDKNGVVYVCDSYRLQLF